MTSAEMESCLRYADYCWPRLSMSPEQKDGTAKAYALSLLRFDHRDVMQALTNLVESPRSKFYPALGAVIEAVHGVTRDRQLRAPIVPRLPSTSRTVSPAEDFVLGMQADRERTWAEVERWMSANNATPEYRKAALAKTRHVGPMEAAMYRRIRDHGSPTGNGWVGLKRMRTNERETHASVADFVNGTAA